MSHVCVFAGGAALAKPIIEHFLVKGDYVTAVCRNDPMLSRCCKHLSVVERSGRVEAPVDVLVTLPGSTLSDVLERMPLANWVRVLDDTLTAVFEAMHDLLPKMQSGSNVVVVGSIIGSTGGYGCANYAAAKAGLVGLVRAAANELAKRDVCVNLLELGYVNAGMGSRLSPKVREAALTTVPLRRFAEPVEVVQAVDFLSSVRYMTGNTLTLAGGLR